ncbi:MAG TPA: metalloregulator ArsR/SmtB family transcription factor [Gemmatimonadales bacterium]|nr:metalloregulator ArsR/SmtB family transcription factor [Gemmatimonadales bacterium]
MSYGNALTALADPTRRRLYERLRRRPHTVGELARLARVSQPAVSQHLKVLSGARLVSVRPDGVRRYYQATPEGLRDLRAWLDAMWDDVLSAYARGTTDPT